MPPSEISHYRILRKLGAGGMGEVFLAEDSTLGRKVAIKMLSERWAGSDQARQRLITYSVDGVQYVSVMAGWGGPSATFNAPDQGKTKPGYGRMLTFALGGTATLTQRAFGRTGPPTPAITLNASPEVIHEGQLLYTANCTQCHGLSVVAGPLPDLRYATPSGDEQFEAIVLGGARATLGMPPFTDLLKPDQVKAIQAYVLSRAKESASAPAK